MSDPRRKKQARAAGSGDASALPDRPRVVVVGAGIAGLAAATGLAERGVAVDLVERQPISAAGSVDGTKRCRTAPKSR